MLLCTHRMKSWGKSAPSICSGQLFITTCFFPFEYRVRERVLPIPDFVLFKTIRPQDFKRVESI